MPTSTVADAVADLVDAFPDKAPEEATVRLYISSLADVPPDLLAGAVAQIIRTKTDDWFPTIGRVREAVAERALDLPSEAEALRQVDARIAWARLPERDRDAPPPVHPLVSEALDRVGGYHAVRTSDRPDLLWSTLGRLYRDLRSSAILDVQSGRTPLSAPARALEAGLRPNGAVS